MITMKEIEEQIDATTEMAREAEKGLAKIKRLDVKEKELMDEVDAIIKTAPYGQWPPVAHRTIDKANKIRQQKAEIWNEIRHFVVKPTGKTLWQIAVESEELVTVRFGKEKHLDFTAQDIKKEISALQKACDGRLKKPKKVRVKK